MADGINDCLLEERGQWKLDFHNIAFVPVEKSFPAGYQSYTCANLDKFVKTLGITDYNYSCYYDFDKYIEKLLLNNG